MALFQDSIIRKYQNHLDFNRVENAWKKFQAHFHNTAIQENIRNSKEEQYQGGFIIDLFVEVLGYTKNPHPDFNITTEYKNEKDAKKADGAIIIDDKVLAVIELKGTDTTDFSKIEIQAFGYKNNQSDCIYVITSNFEKLRFYVDNAIEFLEFNLFQLSRKDFELLYLCLNYNQIRNGIPKKMKDESLVKEEDITKKLYKDYSEFKRVLFDNLCKNHPKHNPLEIFKRTQKLLDRFLFVFFAEDRGLIPPYSVRRIIGEWETLKDLNAYTPLLDRFRQFFEFLNKGHSGKDYEIFAYNGGLFEPDEFLDSIRIDDQLLYDYTVKLADYNFESEVDVNILGHIFENSLNEIDEIKASLSGEAIEKTKTKRKKDGVFYTPKYITKYMVANTVGKLCDEKKVELKLVEEEYTTDKRRQKSTIKKLQEKLKTYRKWLLEITICDPACGSGAFLNQALEFLIAEHRYIDELEAKLFGDALVLTDIENSILENNLYGVDINEESVEIAKLSLWLRTAQQNRKLNNLNNNLKCGNSLINNPEIGGEKSFDWEKEFPKVFDSKGGFDVIISNPPYVKLETIKVESEKLEKCGFETFDKRGDLYVLFVEKGFSLLKPDGKISFIMPNKWLQAGYGKKLRKYFLNKNLELLIDFGDIQIFEGATTYPVIYFAQNQPPKEKFKAAVLDKNKMDDFVYNVESNTDEFNTKDFSADTWVISSKKEYELLGKLNEKFKPLKEFVNGEALRGILTGLSKAFIIDDQTEKSINKFENNSFTKKLVQGRDISRYGKLTENNFMIVIEKGYTKDRFGNESEDESLKLMKTEFSDLFQWLEPFSERAKKRTDKGDFWWELRACDYYDDFQKPKIMYQTFQVKPCFIFDEEGFYCNNSMWIIPTENKALLAILNSKMGWWLITKYCTQIQNGYQLIWKYFGEIPIAPTTNELADKANLMLGLHKDLQNISDKLLKLLHSEFDLGKISRKLKNWYQSDFSEFTKELKKNKITLSLSQKSEWMEFFEKEKEKARIIQQQINQTDYEINDLVYRMYGLSKEEIEIVEGTEFYK